MSERREIFDWAHRYVAHWEGGFVDHASDPGGATNWGISLRFLRSARLDLNRDGRIDAADIRGLSKADAAEIYHDHFWRPARCHELPAPLALLHYDCAVNQGLGRAARILQRVVGAKRDGIIGPATLKAARAAYDADAAAVLRDYAVRRALHYAGLSIFRVFGLGWMRRLFAVHAAAHGVLARPFWTPPPEPPSERPSPTV